MSLVPSSGLDQSCFWRSHSLLNSAADALCEIKTSKQDTAPSDDAV